MIKKLQNQLILFACLPVIVLGSVLGYYFIDSRIKDIESNLVDRGQTIARQTASALEYSVLIENYTLMTDIVDRVLIEPDIMAVLVRDRADSLLLTKYSNADHQLDHIDGEVLVTGDQQITQDMLVFAQEILQNVVDVDDYSVASSSQSIADTEKIGTVQVFIDKTSSLQRQTTVIRNGVVIILSCLLGMILLAFYMGTKIAKPVMQLTNTVNKIAAGELKQRVAEKSSTEIGQLERGVNDMAAAIEAGRSRLQEKIKELTDDFNVATAALKDSEEKYRDLFENASDVVVTFNTNGDLISTNKAFSEEVYDTQGDTQIPKWSQILAPRSRFRALRINKKHMTSDERFTYELDIISKNNKVKTFEISSRSITKDKNIIGIHAIARDITQRIEFQQALVKARAAAETANKAKSGFLANMSHEIRTPISGIIGFLDLLADSDLSNKQKELLAPVIKSSNQLVAIVNDILDFAKIEAQQIDLQKKPFELYEIVSQSMDMLLPLASRKNIDLRFARQPEDKCHVLGDSVRISQIITNLVSNAIKFTDYGYVSVAVDHQPISLEKVKATIIVEDTGVGISDEDKLHLFDPFWQADSSITRKFEGSGLGLAIANHFVELMGGEITIEDNHRQGTKFIFSLILPSHDERLSRDEKDDKKIEYTFLSSVNVLVIDDNSIVRDYFDTMLSSLKLDHQQVMDRDQALQACSTQQYDLVFLDLHMPGIDGMQTFLDIRNNTEIKQPKIIVSLTADAIVGNREQVLEHGFDDFMAKPMTKTDFIKILNKWFPEKVSVTKNIQRERSKGKTDVLNAKSGIELANGNIELWKKSIHSLAQDVPHYIDVLDKSYSGQSIDSLYSEVHKLAGTASYIGADDLNSAARKLMNLLQAEYELEEKFNLINKLRKSLHKFVEEVSVDYDFSPNLSDMQ